MGLECGLCERDLRSGCHDSCDEPECPGKRRRGPAVAAIGHDGPAGHVEIAHDGFAGDIIGHYVTREGKRGVVVQQDGTRVVHVYGEKWLTPAAEEATKS